MPDLYVVLLTVLVPTETGDGLEHRHDVIKVTSSFEECLRSAQANQMEAPKDMQDSGEVNISCIPLGDTP